MLFSNNTFLIYVTAKGTKVQHFINWSFLIFTISNHSYRLRKVQGSSWMRVAEDRVRWCAIGEAYVQQWTTKYRLMMMYLIVHPHYTCSQGRVY